MVDTQNIKIEIAVIDGSIESVKTGRIYHDDEPDMLKVEVANNDYTRIGLCKIKRRPQGTVVIVLSEQDLIYEVEFDDYNGVSDNLTETVLHNQIEAVISLGSNEA